jgi:hypothetical protein
MDNGLGSHINDGSVRIHGADINTLSEDCTRLCNGRMMSQTESGCHTEFMDCAGIDYLPPGTLTLPAMWRTMAA